MIVELFSSVMTVLLIGCLVALGFYMVDKRLDKYKEDKEEEYTDEELTALNKEMEILSARMREEHK